MKTVAEVQVEIIGVGRSNRKQVADALSVLRDYGLETRVHALGTEVEGELEDVLEAILQIHRSLHKNGAPRLSTTLKIHTRTDKQVSLDEPVRAVEDQSAARSAS